MSERKFAIVAVLATWFCTGCSADFYAHRLVNHNTSPGKIHLIALGTAEQMLRDGRIDRHRLIAMADGVQIDVWCLLGRDKAQLNPTEKSPSGGTVVILHGLLDSKASYFRLARRLAKMGYDVVLPDLRAHGASGGRYITFGAKEHRDVKAVLDALVDDGTVRGPIHVFGVSMGASIAIQYAAADPRCKSVMAVAPFKDLTSIARNFLPLMKTEKYQEVLARAGEIADFDPADASALRAVKKLTCRLLIVHGDSDAIVPFKHGQAIYQAAETPKRLIRVPFIGHSTILVGREKWFARHVDMLARGHLPK
ncbi:MAG TPA: alpha/beta fold hydrolase [Phycisphaerae bacterium]|nr:alpha/beta fold hydrolase [Phycisphaerae bacterium]